MDRTRLAAMAILISTLALGAAACGTGTAADPTPVATFKITPASGTAPAASPTSAATAPATPATPAAAGTTVQIVAANIQFDQSSLTAPVGTVTIELENRDAGIPHNIHVFKGSDASGQSIGMTPVVMGPSTDAVTLTLDTGDYYYRCDVHPNMSGKLTVT